jgi:hypothetical protein
MNYRFPENTISPTGKYEIIYGYKEEFGMGGPCAGSIYLAEKDKPPMFIQGMCYEDIRFADDESCFYFLHLNINRQIQVMQYLFESNTLKLFYDVFEIAAFGSTKTQFGYSVNGKNWIPTENRYNEGLIICDTNDENVETKTIISPKINIIPNDGIEIISIGEERTSVNKRVKGFTAYEGRKIDYYTEFGFHVHYDDENLVEAIEIMIDMQGVFELYDKNPHTIEISEMVEILKSKNNGETNPIDEPEDYMFLELSLGIFRGSTPEKYQLFIEQYKKEEPENFKNGTPEWMLEEFEKTKHFQTILIGKKDYFRNPIYFVKE